MLTKPTLELREKTMSAHLVGLIKKATKVLIDFGKLWAEIKEQGQKEGFPERELTKCLRMQLKKELGWTKDKIFYFIHREKEKERSREKSRKNRDLPNSDAGDGNDIPSSNSIKFNPKRFNPKNIPYYDLAYLREAVLYFYERQKS